MLATKPRGWTGTRTPSALKRVRTTKRRTDVNGPRRSEAKTLVVKAFRAAAAGVAEDTQEALLAALSALDRAAKSGAIHANQAARRKSRLTLRVNAAIGGDQVQTSTKVTKSTGALAAAKAAKARIAAGKAAKAKGAQTAAGKARAALSQDRPSRGRRGRRQGHGGGSGRTEGRREGTGEGQGAARRPRQRPPRPPLPRRPRRLPRRRPRRRASPAAIPRQPERPGTAGAFRFSVRCWAPAPAVRADASGSARRPAPRPPSPRG